MVKSYGTITITATDLATTYWIQTDGTAIIRNTDGKVTPTTITVVPMTKIGNSTPEAFKAHFTVQESDDGKRWTTTVTKTDLVNTYTYTYQDKGSKFIRFQMTNDNGDMLDQSTIPILMQGGTATLYSLDASSPTLNRATNGTLNPSNVRFSSYSLVSDESGQRKDVYAGRFAIYENLDVSNLDLKWVFTQNDVHVLTEDNRWVRVENTDGVAKAKYISTTDESTYIYTPSANAKKILCLFYASGANPDGSTKDLLDYQVVTIGDNGDDAYTIFLDNEFHSFIGANSKAIPDSITIHAIAYQGAKKITPSVSKVTSTGITATPGAATNNEVPITIAITDQLPEKGSITIPITVDGQTFNRVFSYTVAYRVEGIKTIDNQYYLSTSDSAQSGGSWSTTCPKWQKGKYIWTRSLITWTDGKTTTTTPVLATAINAASETAASAQETADGKNTVYYGSAAPNGGTYKVNDLWFNSNQDNAQYRWNGTKWQKQEFGTDALGNISANKITTGTLDASKVTVNNLSANAIKSGTIDAKSVTIKNLDATNITSGTLNSDRIGAGTITADKLTIGSGHNLYDLGYDDFEQISDKVVKNNITLVEQQIYTSKADGVTATIDETTAYVGTRCLKLANSADVTDGYVVLGCADNNNGLIPVLTDKTYIFSAWMKADKSVSAALRLVDTNSKTLLEVMGTVGTSWTRLFGVYTVASGVSKVGISVSNKTASSTLWVDAIQIESGTNKQSPSEWHSAGNTILNGSQITAGSVTARQIAAKSITANQILANTITSAEIAAGTIKAVNIEGGSITGDKIAGETIEGKNIKGKTITADQIQTDTITALGKVTAGSFNLGNGKFTVTSDGVLTATSGKIGGWDIKDGSLSSTNSSNKTAFIQNQNSGFWTLAIGATNANDGGTAPFRVDHDGTLYATGAHISGQVEISKSSLSSSLANTDANVWYEREIDTTSLDKDTWYICFAKVTIPSQFKISKVRCMATLDGKHTAVWSSHNSGCFVCDIMASCQRPDWGTIQQGYATIQSNKWYWIQDQICPAYVWFATSSNGVFFWLRGGAVYTLAATWDTDWVLLSGSANNKAMWGSGDEQTYSPTKNPSQYANQNGVIRTLSANTTTIDGGKITTGSITALGNVTAGSFNLGNGKFKVSSDGYLTATGANITGTVSADHFSARDGSIGGYTINVGSLSGSGSSGVISGGQIQGTSITGSVLQSPGASSQGVSGYYTVSDMGLGFVGSVIPYDSGDGQFWNRTEHSFLTWDGENWEIDGGTIYTSNNFSLDTSKFITTSNISSQSVSYANNAGHATRADDATYADYANAVQGGLGNISFRWAKDSNGAYHIQTQGWNGTWHTIMGDQGSNWS